jgi:hypothetical protein
MRLIRATMLTLAVLSPTTLLAQDTITIPADTKLADVLLTVYETEILDNIAAGADPASALSDLADAFIITQAITSQLSTFPLGSSAGGFSWTFSPGTGTLTRSSESFGPIFAERALTVGRGRLNLGMNYQRTSFDSFEGRSLEDREIAFYTPFPGFDVLGEDTLRLTLTQQTFGFFANYGVTDRLDVGVAVPVVHTRLEADLRFHFLDLGGNRIGDFEIFTEGGGSATGISDIVARAKYRVLDLEGGGIAGGLDLRLPTGDEENLLGIPGTQAKIYGIFSMTSGRISPHANVGYTFSSGNDLVDDPNTVFLEPPDELSYALGVDVAVTPLVTIAGDIVGRSIRDVPRLTFGDVGLGTRFSEFSFEGNSTLNTLLAAIGAKFNVAGNLLISANLLLPLSEGGLRPKPTPVIGADYSF